MITLLQEWLTRQVSVRPEAIAVVNGGETLTYARLEEESNRVARMLQLAGCRKGDRVCFFIPKSPAAIISILGILKADCIYTPIDTASPAPRAAKILGSLQPRMILVDGTAPQVLPVLDTIAGGGHLRTVSVGWLNGAPANAGFIPAFTQTDVLNQPATPLSYHNTSDDAAYILFTSGSTGTPKGVVITHANVIRFVEWAVRYFDVQPGDRHSGHIPLHFDLSVFDMFGAIAGGAELHLVPPALNIIPHTLAEFIRGSGLTQWFSVPSTLNYLANFDAVRQGDFPAMKRLLWCGEVFPTPSLKYWMTRLPHVKFTNLYGPTETTIASSHYTVPRCPDDDRAPIPIGAACDGEELLVLDDDLRPMPVGEIGDLYIGGVGLSPGYWRDQKRTDAVFLPHPFHEGSRLYKTGDLAKVGGDGLVYFVGRADSQIKSRGYRIELGEIEVALNALGVIRESAVVAITTNHFEGVTICCAYVPAEHTHVTPLSLRKGLEDVLPSYMLPVQWMAFERLPKSANGKIDRSAIKELFLFDIAGAPSNRVERALPTRREELV